MKKSGTLGVAMITAIFAIAGCRHQPKNKELRLAVTSIGPIPLIREVVSGFRSEMGTTMDGKRVVILEKNANGDVGQIDSMLNAVLAEHPDVLVTITTPVSQKALKSAPASVPIVFVGVTDPLGARLVKTLEHPEWSTGVSDAPPLEKTLQMIRLLTPDVKRIGFIYSANEEPAVYSRDLVERLAGQYGFTVEARAATSQGELPALVRGLISRNDALMVGSDNQMFAAAPLLAKIAMEAHKPYFAADSSSVKAGALAGVTVDYTELGRTGARTVKSVLQGAKVGDKPVVTLSDGFLEVNRETMKKLGLSVPPTLEAQIRHPHS